MTQAVCAWWGGGGVILWTTHIVRSLDLCCTSSKHEAINLQDSTVLAKGGNRISESKEGRCVCGGGGGGGLLSTKTQCMRVHACDVLFSPLYEVEPPPPPPKKKRKKKNGGGGF